MYVVVYVCNVLTAYLVRKYGHHPFSLPNAFMSSCREGGREGVKSEQL